jgi:hypothetical protein
LITAEEAQKLLSYDKETGALTWKVRPWLSGTSAHWNGRYPGTIAGKLNKGHRYIAIDRKMYAAHRLVWLISYGEFPTEDIDHINGNGDDNRLANLRLATRSQNLCNRDISKVRGCYLHKQSGLWHSSIKVNGRKISLGYFKSCEESSAVYRQAKIKFHGEFAGY